MREDASASRPPPPLDPARVLPAAERAAAQGRSGTLVFGLVLSLALHLSPVGLLWDWRDPPPETPTPIPVQLVVEPLPPEPAPPPPAPPPPAPPPPKAAATPPPPGRLASEEMGAPADEPGASAAEPAPAEPEPRPEPENRQAMLVAPPKTAPEPEPLDLPTPSLKPPPAAVAPASVRRPPSPPRQRSARAPGPAATRDEYLAYLAALTRPRLRLLPPSLINGRRGKTSLSIRVLGDGTIARISVSESSGYPDLDARVVQLIAAIGRFPPLPQWIQAPAWDINFHLRFPIPQSALQ